MHPQALHFSRKPYRHAKGPISEGAGIERSEMTGGVPSGVPERADFPSFRPKFHVLGRKSQTIKQNAQKGDAKFGGDTFDRPRKNIFEKQQSKLKRTSAAKLKFAQTNKISGYILFDMGTIPKKY